MRQSPARWHVESSLMLYPLRILTIRLMMITELTCKGEQSVETLSLILTIVLIICTDVCSFPQVLVCIKSLL